MLMYPMIVTECTHCPIACLFILFFFFIINTHTTAVSWARSTFVIWPENLTPTYYNVSVRKFFQLPNTPHKNKMLAPLVPKLSPQLADIFIKMLFIFALLRSLSWLKFAILCCISASEKMHEFQRNVWIGHFSHFLQRPHSQFNFLVPWDGWNFQLWRSLTSVLVTHFPGERTRTWRG